MNFYIASSFANHKLVNDLSEKLVKLGWNHTYNWANHIAENETIEDLVKHATFEQNAIINSDVVIVLLPGGRGTHVELGMALALNKKIYLYSKNEEDFSINTVDFYRLPSITRIYGNIDDIVKYVTSNN